MPVVGMADIGEGAVTAVRANSSRGARMRTNRAALQSVRRRAAFMPLLADLNRPAGPSITSVCTAASTHSPKTYVIDFRYVRPAQGRCPAHTATTKR